jgi:hypothetical protein
VEIIGDKWRFIEISRDWWRLMEIKRKARKIEIKNR